MARETEVNGANARSAAPRAVVENIGEFVHDVVTLSELQSKLFVADLKDFRSGTVAPGSLMGLASVLFVGCVPVLLMGIAWLLVDYDVLAPGWAFLAAGSGGAIVAGLMALTGWLIFRRQLAILDRSRAELEKNVTWIKSVLKHSGRTPRDPHLVINRPK